MFKIILSAILNFIFLIAAQAATHTEKYSSIAHDKDQMQNVVIDYKYE